MLFLIAGIVVVIGGAVVGGMAAAGVFSSSDKQHKVVYMMYERVTESGDGSADLAAEQTAVDAAAATAIKEHIAGTEADPKKYAFVKDHITVAGSLEDHAMVYVVQGTTSNGKLLARWMVDEALTTAETDALKAVFLANMTFADGATDADKNTDVEAAMAALDMDAVHGEVKTAVAALTQTDVPKSQPMFAKTQRMTEYKMEGGVHVPNVAASTGKKDFTIALYSTTSTTAVDVTDNTAVSNVNYADTMDAAIMKTVAWVMAADIYWPKEFITVAAGTATNEVVVSLHDIAEHVEGTTYTDRDAVDTALGTAMSGLASTNDGTNYTPGGTLADELTNVSITTIEPVARSTAALRRMRRA